MLLFDIVIPTYNNLAELKKCLGSFEAQTVKEFKVWVAIDGSTDGTIEFLSTQSYSFNVSFLQHADGKNNGRAATRNLVLPYLSARYVLFLDSDFVVGPDFLQRHQVVLSKGDCVSVGKIIYEKGNIWRDYDQTRGMHQFKEDLAELPAKYLVAGNIAMPATVFSALKGFDEQIATYGGEDTELGCRIRDEFGCKTIFNKYAIAFGTFKKSLSFALQQREEFARKNFKYLINKHPWADDVFRINIIRSKWGKVLYCLTPRKLLMVASESSLLPVALRIKMVHLLVFYHLYRGYHKKG